METEITARAHKDGSRIAHSIAFAFSEDGKRFEVAMTVANAKRFASKVAALAERLEGNEAIFDAMVEMAGDDVEALQAARAAAMQLLATLERKANGSPGAQNQPENDATIVPATTAQVISIERGKGPFRSRE